MGDAGANLGDSMYDGTIYVGGKIADLGVDAGGRRDDRVGYPLAFGKTRAI